MTTGPSQTTDTEEEQKTKNVAKTNASSNVNSTTNATTQQQQQSQQDATSANQSSQQGVTAGVNQNTFYQPAGSLLDDILGAANGAVANAGPNAAQTAAVAGISDAAGTAAGFNPQLVDLAQKQLNGGGYGEGQGYITDAHDASTAALMPYANGSMLDFNNPQLQGMLATLRDQVTNSVGGQFANAGRSFSGAHSNALGKGMTDAEAPVMLNYLLQQQQNQMNAGNSLASNANAASGALDNIAGNKLAAGNAAAGTLAQTYNPFTADLSAQEYLQQLPTKNLGMLSDLVLPIAQAGGGSVNLGLSNQTGQETGQQSQTGLVNTDGSAVTNTVGSENSMSKVKQKGSGTTTGTSTTQQTTDPLQTAIGAGVGLGGMLLSPAGAGSKYGTVGASLLAGL